MTNKYTKYISIISAIEKSAVDIIAVFSPWFAPVPSAYLVGKAVYEHLQWHWIVALIAAIAVESIGVVSVVVALRLYEWNETKNKTDPFAPFWLSVSTVCVYFIVTIALTILLDVFPTLAQYAPAIFPLLAAVGAVNIAIKNGQQRREDDKLEKKSNHKTKPKTKPLGQPQNETNATVASPVSNLSGTKLLVYEAYRRNPNATQQDVANELQISRQMVGKHKKSMNGIMKNKDGK